MAAARGVFLECGIQGTTAEVARRAGVAEGSVFNHFHSKAELFRVATDPDRTTDCPQMDIPQLRDHGDPRESLELFGHAVLTNLRRTLPLMMVRWSNRGADAACDPKRRQAFREAARPIAHALESEMRAGRMRRHDPETAARVLLGGLYSYAFGELMLGEGNGSDVRARTYIRNVVQMLWDGLAPNPRGRTENDKK